MDINQKGKYAIGIILGAIVGFAGAAGLVKAPEPTVLEVPVMNPVNTQLQSSLDACNAKEPEQIVEIKEVPVEVPVEVEVEKIVEIDNGNLELVLEHIYDNNGMIEYLTDDLDDDEIDQIVDRIDFINSMKSQAVQEVKDEGIDELDKEEYNEIKFDEDDIERFKVYDADDEIEVDDLDFEDGDGDAYVWARFEQDDVKYKALFKITFKDGEIDDFRLEDVALRE